MTRTLAILLLAACASAPRPAAKGGPRGLHADEHLDLARQHDQLAQQSTAWPDHRPPAPGEPAIIWTRSWDPGADHERIANFHRSKADQLHGAYMDACGTRPLSEVSVSPLQRYASGGWNTQSGVVLYLDRSAPAADQLVADMKCHRAWMMLQEAQMEHCPLDLPGILLDARGGPEGITVVISVSDPKLVDELHRRAAHELEASARRRGRAH